MSRPPHKLVCLLWCAVFATCLMGPVVEATALAGLEDTAVNDLGAVGQTEVLLSLQDFEGDSQEPSDDLQAEVDREVAAEEKEEEASPAALLRHEGTTDSPEQYATPMLYPAPSLSDITSDDLQKEVDDEVHREERKQSKVGAGSLDKLSKEMLDLKADLESETGRSAQQVSDAQIQMSAAEYAREAKAKAVEKAKVNLNEAVEAVKDTEKDLLAAQKDADEKEQVADERETKAQKATRVRAQDSQELVKEEEQAESQVNSIEPQMQTLIENLHDAKTKAQELESDDDKAETKEEKDDETTASKVEGEQAEEKTKEQDADTLVAKYGSTLDKVEDALQLAQKKAIRSVADEEMAKVSAEDADDDLQTAKDDEMAAKHDLQKADANLKKYSDGYETEKITLKMNERQAKRDVKNAKQETRSAAEREGEMLMKDTQDQADDQGKLKNAERKSKKVAVRLNAMLRKEQDREQTAQDVQLKAQTAEIEAKKEADVVAKRLATTQGEDAAAVKKLSDLRQNGALLESEEALADQLREDKKEAEKSVEEKKETSEKQLEKMEEGHQKLTEKLKQGKLAAAAARDAIRKDQDDITAAKEGQTSKQKLQSRIDHLKASVASADDVVDTETQKARDDELRMKAIVKHDQDMILRQKSLENIYRNRTQTIQDKIVSVDADHDHNVETLTSSLREVAQLNNKLQEEKTLTETKANPSKIRALESIMTAASNAAMGAQRNVDSSVAQRIELVKQLTDAQHLMSLTNNETEAMQKEASARESLERAKIAGMSKEQREARSKATEARIAVDHAMQELDAVDGKRLRGNDSLANYPNEGYETFQAQSAAVSGDLEAFQAEAKEAHEELVQAESQKEAAQTHLDLLNDVDVQMSSVTAAKNDVATAEAAVSEALGRHAVAYEMNTVREELVSRKGVLEQRKAKLAEKQAGVQDHALAAAQKRVNSLSDSAEAARATVKAAQDKLAAKEAEAESLKMLENSDIPGPKGPAAKIVAANISATERAQQMAINSFKADLEEKQSEMRNITDTFERAESDLESQKAADFQQVDAIEHQELLTEARARLDELRVRVTALKAKLVSVKEKLTLAKAQASVNKEALTSDARASVEKDNNNAFLESFHAAADAILQQAYELRTLDNNEQKMMMKERLLSSIKSLRDELRAPGSVEEEALSGALLTAEESAMKGLTPGGEDTKAGEMATQQGQEEVAEFVKQVIIRNKGKFSNSMLTLLDSIRHLAGDRATLAKERMAVDEITKATMESASKLQTVNATFTSSITEATRLAAEKLKAYTTEVKKAAEVSPTAELQLELEATEQVNSGTKSDVQKAEERLHEYRAHVLLKKDNDTMLVVNLQAQLERHRQMKEVLSASAADAISSLTSLQQQHKATLDRIKQDEALSLDNKSQDEAKQEFAEASGQLSAAEEKADLVRENWEAAMSQDQKAARMAMDAVQVAATRQEQAKKLMDVTVGKMNATDVRIAAAEKRVLDREEMLSALETLVSTVSNQMAATAVKKKDAYEARKAEQELAAQATMEKLDAEQAAADYEQTVSGGSVELAAFEDQTAGAQMKLQEATSNLNATEQMPLEDTEDARGYRAAKLKMLTNQKVSAQNLYDSAQNAEAAAKIRVEEQIQAAAEKRNETAVLVTTTESSYEAATEDVTLADAAVLVAENDQSGTEGMVTAKELELSHDLKSVKLADLMSAVKVRKAKVSSARSASQESAGKLLHKQSLRKEAADKFADLEAEARRLKHAVSGLRALKGDLEITRLQKDHAAAALEAIGDKVRAVKLANNEKNANDRAQADKRVAAAKEDRLIAGRNSRDAEGTLHYATAQASSSEEAVQHFMNAIDSSRRDFQKQRQKDKSTGTKEWNALQAAKDNEKAKQQTVIAMETKIQLTNQDAGALVQELTAEYKSKAANDAAKSELESAQSELLARQHDKEAKQRIDEDNEEKSQLGISKLKIKESTIETNSRRAAHSLGVLDAAVKTLNGTITSIRNVEAQGLAAGSAAKAELEAASEAYEEVERQRMEGAENVTDAMVDQLQGTMEAAERKLTLTESSATGALNAALMPKSNSGAVLSKQSLIANLTELLQDAEAADGQAQLRLDEAKDNAAGKAAAAEESAEGMGAAVATVQSTEEQSEAAEQYVARLRAQLDQAAEDSEAASKDVSRYDKNLKVAQDITKSREKLLGILVETKDDSVKRMAVMKKVAQYAARLHNEAEDQVDTADVILQPLLDTNQTEVNTSHINMDVLQNHVVAAQKDSKVVSMLKGVAMQNEYSSKAYADRYSEGLTEKESELNAAETALATATNTEENKVGAIKDMSGVMSDALAEWKTKTHEHHVALSESHVASVEHGLMVAKHMVSELRTNTANTPLVEMSTNEGIDEPFAEENAEESTQEADTPESDAPGK